MRSTLFSILFVAFCINSGISQQWYAIGTTMHYETSSFGNMDVSKFTVEGTKQIQGKTCFELSELVTPSYWVQNGPNDPGQRVISPQYVAAPHYLYVENNAVFMLQDTSFLLLWDFNAAIDFSWEYAELPNTSCTRITNTVVAKSDTIINGTSRKMLIIKSNDRNTPGSGEDYYRTIIEGIGSLQTPFFPPALCTIYESISVVRCFNQNGTELHFNNRADCELKLGVDDLGKTEQSFFYPNPAESTLQLNISGAKRIEIADVSGKIVLRKTLQTGINSIDVENLSAGIHIAQVFTDKGLITRRIQITK